ncbi:MAG: hypothetical protein HRT77_14380 [Halioglobus sp.]|nr:hypothetical protein [Halioglobus sp.]
MRESWQTEVLERHQLDATYLDTAHARFEPLAEALARCQRAAKRTLLIGVNGCQGSGKSTLCDYLCAGLKANHALNAVALSLDDFYLTFAQRQSLASSTHPLLATRGVPGTHDVALLRKSLHALLRRSGVEPIAIPRFNKAADDRHSRSRWQAITGSVHLIFLEGWCLGVTAESPDALATPINSLERQEDSNGRWRGYVNAALLRDYMPLYAAIDQWIMLCAPSFDRVFQWRREQERKLAATLPASQAAKLMGDAALHRFIQHYERLTRRCLAELPKQVNHLYTLDDNRRIVDYQQRASRIVTA